MARLVVNPGSPQSWEITLKNGINSIGRGEHNDFRIQDGSVSTSHCHVTVQDGTITIKDLGSTNGTRVDRSKITESTLQQGQRVHVGGVELLVEMDLPQSHGLMVESTPTVAMPPIAETTQTAAPRLQIAKPAAPTLEASVRPSAVGASTAPRLHIARIHTAAPAVEEPSSAEAPPVEFAPVAPPTLPKNTKCKYHPKNAGRWWCLKCSKAYCDLCIATRPHSEGKFCKTCGTQCAPLEVKFIAPTQKNFFAELPKALVYPFRSTGLIILIISTLIFTCLDILRSRSFIFYIPLSIISLGYLFTYIQAIIHSTAAEDESMPDIPGFDGLFGAFFRLAGAVLVAFGIPIALGLGIVNMVSAWNSVSTWGTSTWEPPIPFIAIVGTLVLGCLYFPMALLAVAMKDSAFAANPMLVIPSIFKTPLEYLVTAILLCGVFAIQRVGDVVTNLMSGPANTRSMSTLLTGFALGLIWSFLSIYLLTFNARVLGMLYLTKKRKLGWFNH
jgi:hypothetical protein